MLRRALQFAILLCIVGFGVWLTLPVWQEWATLFPHEKPKGNDSSIVNVAEEDKVRKVALAMLRGYSGKLHISFVPPYVNTDLSDSDFDEQVRLFSDYSPSDSDILLPVWTRVPISDAYRFFLTDYFISEEARLNLDEEAIERLNDLVKQYRRRAQRSGSSFNNKKAVVSLRQSVLRFLSTHLTDQAQFLEIIEAYSKIPDIEGADLTAAKLPNLTQEWMHGTTLDCREQFQGIGRLSVGSVENEIHVDVPMTVWGADYRFLPFITPNWFRVDLLRRGRDAARLLNVRDQEYFGPKGYLSRIPVGIVAKKLDHIEVNIPATELWRIREVSRASTGQVTLNVNDYVLLLTHDDLGVLVSGGLLSLPVTPARIRISAVVSEVVQ